MERVKVAEVKGGEIIVQPILKSFYCTRCTDIGPCRPKGHRNGFWFLLRVDTPGKRFYVLDGWGETCDDIFIDKLVEWEQIGKRIYEANISGLKIKCYTTVSGWASFYPLPFIFSADQQLEEKISQLKTCKEFQVTFSDFVEIMRILQNNLIRKYHIFDNFDLNDIQLNPAFSHLYPLLKVYKRANTFNFPNATLQEKANSFSSIFRPDNFPFSIRIPKKYYLPPTPQKNYYLFSTPNQTIHIAYNSSFLCYVERVVDTAHFTVFDADFLPFHFSAHANSLLYIDFALDVLFNYRLKEFIFPPLSYEPYLSKVFYYPFNFPANYDQLEFENATLDKDNFIIHPVSSEPVIIRLQDRYITLPPTDTYKLFSPRCVLINHETEARSIERKFII